jgi:hypothetical protein
MPPNNDRPADGITRAEPRWPLMLVTGLIATGAVLLVSPNELNGLSGFARRQRLILAHPSDPSYRELFPTVAFYRRLNNQLAPDAHIFLSGMIGPDKSQRLYYYFFATTYLFPREVQISLDRKPVYQDDAFIGVDSASPDEVRNHGFDVLLKVERDGSLSVTALTPKGIFKK